MSYRGQTHSLFLASDSTIEALQLQLEDLTAVPSGLQKLLYKGKKPSLTPDSTLEDAGIKNGIKIQLVGSTEKELDKMRTAEDAKRRRDDILARRAGMKLPKVC